MRKIFLDCGSFDGCSVRKFRDIRADADEFEIYCFEPNPNLARYHPVENCYFFPKRCGLKTALFDYMFTGLMALAQLLTLKPKITIEKLVKTQWFFHT